LTSVAAVLALAARSALAKKSGQCRCSRGGSLAVSLRLQPAQQLEHRRRQRRRFDRLERQPAQRFGLPHRVRPGTGNNSAMGHDVRVIDQTSGAQAILRTKSGWIGGADPRREGTVRGE